jgi:hypothetical protein
MAKCKICKTNIPDGTEYCKNCQDKEKAKLSESYLDSLLNSVKNTVPTVENVYKKKNDLDMSNPSNNPDENPNNDSNNDSSNNSGKYSGKYSGNTLENNSKNNSENNLENNTVNNLDNDTDNNSDNYSDIKADDKADSQSGDDDIYDVDLSDIEDFDQFNLDDDLDDVKDDIEIGDEELFGDDLSDILKVDEENNAQDVIESKSFADEKVAGEEEQTIIDESESQPNSPSINQNEREDNSNVIPPADLPVNNISPKEIQEFYNEEDTDQELNALLNSLDDIQGSSKVTETLKPEENRNNNEQENDGDKEQENDKNNPDLNDENNILGDGIEPINTDEFEQIDSDEDDFLSLLNQISSDDPVAEDVRAISDILSGGPIETQKKQETPSDVGEVFSDALKVVSSLNDHEINEAEILDQIPDKDKKKDKKSKKKSKKAQPEEEVEQKPKKGLLQRLFGNVEDKNAKKKNSSKPKYNLPTGEGEENKDLKQKKGKKGKKAKELDAEEILDTGRPGKDKSAEDKAADKKANKKEAKEKKKKAKEVIQVIDELEEDEGRINRLGAAIVFIFFGLLVILLLAGTNLISYTISIQNATEYFNNKKYTEAYDEVDGVEIKDEDKELFSKIQTVMFVNKQLNSYNNYYSIGDYPEALDSLLKGLKRYDKYIELATLLGIKSDLDYVRKQILAELDNVFNLSEDDVQKLIDNDDMEEYSLEVYEVVSEKMNDKN